MCDMCLIHEEVIGTVCGDWYLARARDDSESLGVVKGDYVLTQGMYAEVVIKVPPVANPTFRFTDEQYDALPDDEWNEDKPYIAAMYALRKVLVLRPRTGYELYTAMLAAGYLPDEDGDVATWLTHTMGVVIAKYQSSVIPSSD